MSHDRWTMEDSAERSCVLSSAFHKHDCNPSRAQLKTVLVGRSACCNEHTAYSCTAVQQPTTEPSSRTYERAPNAIGSVVAIHLSETILVSHQLMPDRMMTMTMLEMMNNCPESLTIVVDRYVSGRHQSIFPSWCDSGDEHR